MNASGPVSSPDPQFLFERIADAVAQQGWGVFSAALPVGFALDLAHRARCIDDYAPAGIGRNQQHQLNQFVRRDEVRWIDGEDDAEHNWLMWTASLQTSLNRTLMLGLHDLESHFACYTPGSFYRRHVDAFSGDSNRIISVVAYLNPLWQPADGGELVLYDLRGKELDRIAPRLGTVVVYLSEQFPHEVLPTNTNRYSIAGWFRRRPELPVDAIG